MNKAETQADRDYNEEVQRIMEEGDPMSSGTSIQESPPSSDDENDDDYDGWATDDGGEEEKADAYDSDTDSIQLGDMEGDMGDERDDDDSDAYDSDE